MRGVTLRDRASGSEDHELRADLVVAATGRGGRVPAWVEEMGYERPAEDRVEVDIMYASRNMRLRPGALGHDIRRGAEFSASARMPPPCEGGVCPTYSIESAPS